MITVNTQFMFILQRNEPHRWCNG